MKLIKTMACFALLPCLLSAQVTDDFSDGDFFNNPSWTGTTGKFIVNVDLALQLNDSDAGEAWLVTEFTPGNTMEWRFRATLKFSPSSNNHACIYLLSTHDDLHQDPDGVFVRLGESGSSDAPELFVRTNGVEESICRGEEGSIASSFDLSMKIIYQDGAWDMMADLNGGSYYQHAGSGVHTLNCTGACLGVYCTYTKSNSTKFYFDDFHAGPPVIDTVPPICMNMNIADSCSLRLEFSEALNLELASDSNHYLLLPCNLNPATVETNLQEPEMIVLHFSEVFENEAGYRLHVAGLQDLAGNVMEAWNQDFLYFVPGPYDVVISEIMADPSPTAGLPEEEYLELFNASAFPVHMDQWMLEINGTPKTIEKSVIPAGEYLILTGEDAKSHFQSYGATALVTGLSLVNNGAELVLKNQDGREIHRIAFDPLWHSTAEKQEGGYSLEIINPYNPCMEEGNWVSSENNMGGTPGQQNSVFLDEFLPLELSNLCVENDSTLSLVFSQNLHPDILERPEAFHIGPYNIEVKKVTRIKAGTRFFALHLSGKLVKDATYALEILSGIMNCNGTTETFFQESFFGLPGDILENDIVINEVLFDPLDGCNEYVELCNNSGRPVRLDNLCLWYVKEHWPEPNDTTGGRLTDECLMLMPGDFIVFTPAPELVTPCYFAENPGRIYMMDNFPAFGNSGGIILLTDEGGTTIDRMEYSEDMHFPLLQFTGGISLERIHPGMLSGDPESWHSASQDCGFGTPTYRNSQFSEYFGEEDPVSVHPGIIYPRKMTGENAVCIISYKFRDEGHMCSITIFDDAGYPQRILADQILLGTEGMFAWDGTDGRGIVCRKGIYIIVFEVFHLSGKTRKYKKVIVVGE